MNLSRFKTIQSKSGYYRDYTSQLAESYKHTKERMAERYGLDLTFEEYAELSMKCFCDKEAEFLRLLNQDTSIYKAEFKGKTVGLFFSERLYTIMTAIPGDSGHLQYTFQSATVNHRNLIERRERAQSMTTLSITPVPMMPVEAPQKPPLIQSVLDAATEALARIDQDSADTTRRIAELELAIANMRAGNEEFEKRRSGVEYLKNMALQTVEQLEQGFIDEFTAETMIAGVAQSLKPKPEKPKVEVSGTKKVHGNTGPARTYFDYSKGHPDIRKRGAGPKTTYVWRGMSKNTREWAKYCNIEDHVFRKNIKDDGLCMAAILTVAYNRKIQEAAEHESTKTN